MTMAGKSADHREGEYTEVVRLGVRFSAIPRQWLVSIVDVLENVCATSEGRVSVPELADALIRVYDSDSMMIYDASGYGLASPIGDDHLGTVGGYNKRVDIVCDLFNSRFWDAACLGNIGRLDAKDICVSKEDGQKLGEALRAFFFPEDLAKDVTTLPSKGTGVPDYLNPNHPRFAPKLAAAVNAWLAVTDPGPRTPKQALERWLRENATQFGMTNDDGAPINQAITECAKVANWAPEGGAAKTPGG